MSESCDFCSGPVNPHDESTYKQVLGWVHGKKRDSMTLREDTNRYAHTHCIVKAKAGQPTDQPDLFDEEQPAATAEAKPEAGGLIEELFDKVAPPPTIQGLGESLGLAKRPAPSPGEAGYF